jgi:ABC-2 type transport system permease protein
MTDVTVIIRKDLGEMLHNRAMIMMLVVSCFIIFMIANSFGSGIESLSKQAVSDTELYETVRAMVGTLCMMIVFLIMLLVSLYMNAYTVLLEKTRRTLESLLCTPVKLKNLWLGKTLATFIPSLIIGLLLGAIVLIIINLTVIVPEAGRWILPDAAALVTALIALPLIVFLLSSLVIMLQLMLQNVRLIQTVFTALIFGSSFGLSYVFRYTDTGWMVALGALGLALLLGLVIWFISRNLTKERIVLTSKG